MQEEATSMCQAGIAHAYSPFFSRPAAQKNTCPPASRATMYVQNPTSFDEVDKLEGRTYLD